MLLHIRNFMYKFTDVFASFYSSISPHNLKVREALVKEITNLPDCQFAENTVKGKLFITFNYNDLACNCALTNNTIILATICLPIYMCIAAVKRCYEGLRRNLLENQEGKEEYTEDQAKRRKYRSRRQRVSLHEC